MKINFFQNFQSLCHEIFLHPANVIDRVLSHPTEGSGSRTAVGTSQRYGYLWFFYMFNIHSDDQLEPSDMEHIDESHTWRLDIIRDWNHFPHQGLVFTGTTVFPHQHTRSSNVDWWDRLSPEPYKGILFDFSRTLLTQSSPQLGRSNSRAASLVFSQKVVSSRRNTNACKVFVDKNKEAQLGCCSQKDTA